MSTTLLATVRRLVEELIFPPRCASCERAGPPLCESCLVAIRRFEGPRCPRCDAPTSSPEQCARCRAAEREPAALDALRVVGPHEGTLRAAIHGLKYRGRRRSAEKLGVLLAEAWLARPTYPVDGLIPVPLHPDRERERGFNQAVALAEAVAARLDRPLCLDRLDRRRSTPPQVGSGRAERWANVAGAFVARDVAGGRWLLVDDVCTSGATLEACAAALREAGAARVCALVLARAQLG